MWEAFTQDTFCLKKDYKKWYEAIYGESAIPWDSKVKRFSFIICNLEKEGFIKKGKKEIILVGLINRKKKDRAYIYVPEEFWTEGWIRRLSYPALYFYLVNLYEFKKSVYKPVWMKSQEKLSQEYGVARTNISQTFKELMYYNLIEIKHDIPDADQSFSERKANRYFINPLWGEKEWQEKWNQLANRHGLDLVNKARQLAIRINEPYDLKVIADLIMLMKIYGKKAVTSAIDTVTKLSFENGKWELRYIIGILQRDYTPVVLYPPE